MTKTTICNMALDHVACNNIANINDTSKEAQRCKLHYDTALKSLLEEHKWGFAERRVALALVSGVDPSDYSGYTYAYTYPGDCLVANEIYNPLSNKATDKIPFILGTNAAKDTVYIYTNQEDAYLIYTASTDSFTAMKSSLFQRALSHQLAALIAMPLTSNKVLRDDNLNMAFGLTAQAKDKDSKEEHEDTENFEGYVDATY